MKKKIIVIPGFGGNKTTDVYKKFKKQFNASIFVPTWKYRTPKDWVEEYEAFIKNNNITDFTAVGFSMGAYIMACSKTKPTKSIYASISPFFKEDTKTWSKREKKYLGKRRFSAMGTYIKKPNSIFMVGSKERQSVFDVVKRIGGKSKVMIVKDTPHHITPYYFGKISDLIK